MCIKFENWFLHGSGPHGPQRFGPFGVPRSRERSVQPRCLTSLMCLAVIINILLNFVYSHTPLQNISNLWGLFSRLYLVSEVLVVFSTMYEISSGITYFYSLVYKKWGF